VRHRCAKCLVAGNEKQAVASRSDRGRRRLRQRIGVEDPVKERVDEQSLPVRSLNLSLVIISIFLLWQMRLSLTIVTDELPMPAIISTLLILIPSHDFACNISLILVIANEQFNLAPRDL
jgi:hypothetical protein